jgi:Ni/Co efflux regulator RcnB
VFLFGEAHVSAPNRKIQIIMKISRLAIAVSALVASAAGLANAAPNSHQRAAWGQDYRGAHQWKSGERMGHNNWRSARRVDYRQHNLRQPPRGYEWRESNGQFVLAAVATGLISSIILDSAR